ncbi:hypothetical protein CkaCkLH20_11607 [Colletotrichum karsti]|uniref:Uncharacterized protein n=1 Tax=Colletotrichum karsti TaxID=1095194 RepID=A0A9P6HVL8_9PEZI|nr:uncharacterized protein CkaCkLH20_11607 [Colletotrichum karsti]KAF9870935.1 hypothetical protein CkaCkLH20_11607 [Colletotrichum karsti]
MALVSLSVEYLVFLGDLLAEGVTGLLLENSEPILADENHERARLQDSIKDNIEQISQIESSIQTLSSQLSSQLLNLRSPRLTEYLNKVSARYEVVCFELESCLLEQTTRLRVEWTKAPSYSQTRLEAALHSCVCVHVGGIQDCLRDVHSILLSQDKGSLLKVAREVALEESTDFLSFYCKMKVFTMHYWIAQAKGLLMLKMARNWPRVHFAEADDTIECLQSNFVLQEQIFDEVVGSEVISLVKGVMRNPNGLAMVDLHTEDNSRLTPRFDWELEVHVLKLSSEEDEQHPWPLRSISAIDKPVPSGSYAFELISLSPKDSGSLLVSAPHSSPCIM